MKLGRSKEASWHSFTRWWIIVSGQGTSFQLPSFSPRAARCTQTCILFRKKNWRLSNPVLTLRPFVSLSLFCAGGMKNEVDRVRAGILRNRGRDASRNEATTSKPNSNDRAPLFLSPRNRDPPRFPIDDPAFVGLRPRLETRKIGRRSTND